MPPFQPVAPNLLRLEPSRKGIASLNQESRFGRVCVLNAEICCLRQRTCRVAGVRVKLSSRRQIAYTFRFRPMALFVVCITYSVLWPATRRTRGRWNNRQNINATRDGPEQRLVIPPAYRKAHHNSPTIMRIIPAQTNVKRRLSGRSSATQTVATISTIAATNSSIERHGGGITYSVLWPATRRAGGRWNKEQNINATRDGPQQRLVILRQIGQCLSRLIR